MPNLVVLADQKRTSELLALWHVAVRKCSLVIYPIFVLVAVLSKDLIVLAYGEPYKDAVWPFLIYLAELPIRVAIYGGLLRAFGHTKPVAIGAVMGLAINVVVGYSLLRIGHGTLLGFLGPAIGTVVAELAVPVYLMVSIRSALGVSMRKVMPWADLLRVLFLCLLAGLIAAALPMRTASAIVRVVVRSCVFAAAMLGLASWGRLLCQDDREMLVFPFRWLVTACTVRRGTNEPA